MKKTKFMLGALVLSMGLLGTGYALWTDTLAVNTTVNTGHLNIKFDSLKTENHYNDDSLNGVNSNYTTFNSDVALVDGPGRGDYNNEKDQINIKIDDMVPGASTKVTARMVNDGTVAARLAEITATVGGKTNKALQRALDVEIKVLDWKDNEWHTLYTGTLEELVANGKAELQTEVFDTLFVPGTYGDTDINLEINVSISKDATNEIQEKKADFTVDFLFKQAFEDK